MKEFKFLSKKSKEKIKIFGNDNKNEIELSGFRTEIFLNKNLTTEGCLGVMDYRDDYIKIKVKKGYIVFTGNCLNITYFENKTISISGKINNIEFLI